MSISFVFKKFTPEFENVWEEVNHDAANTSFLTSTFWINFQQAIGKNTDRYLIYAQKNNEEVLVGNVYIELYKRKIAKFAYNPYGPVLDEKILESLFGTLADGLVNFYKSFKTFAKDYVRQNNLNLFRFDPLLPKDYLSTLLSVGFKKSLAPTQAKDLWELNITKSEEELKKGMADTNRNMINRGHKNGLELIKVSQQTNKAELINEFYNLMTKTTTKKGFSTFPKDYFVRQFETLSPKGLTEIFLVKHDGQYLAGALINYYKQTAYYSHAGSLSGKEISKLGAPYFLLWEIIQDSKQKNLEKFNFWGVLPEGITNHSLKGVSDFKKKFGGEIISLVGPVETYANPFKYYLQKLTDWWIYKKDRY